MAGPITGLGQQQNFTQFQPGGNSTSVQQQTRERTDTPAQSGVSADNAPTQPQGTQAAQAQQSETSGQNDGENKNVFASQETQSTSSSGDDRGTILDITV